MFCQEHWGFKYNLTKKDYSNCGPPLKMMLLVVLPAVYSWTAAPGAASCANWCHYDIQNCELPHKKEQCQGCEPCAELKKKKDVMEMINAACPPCPKTPACPSISTRSVPPSPCAPSATAPTDCKSAERERDNLRGWIEKVRAERDALRVQADRCGNSRTHEHEAMATFEPTFASSGEAPAAAVHVPADVWLSTGVVSHLVAFVGGALGLIVLIWLRRCIRLCMAGPEVASRPRHRADGNISEKAGPKGKAELDPEPHEPEAESLFKRPLPAVDIEWR